MSAPKLKECPFCRGELWLDKGSEVVHWWRHPMNKKEHASCPAYVINGIEDWPERDVERIAAWNRRTPSELLASRLAKQAPAWQFEDALEPFLRVAKHVVAHPAQYQGALMRTGGLAEPADLHARDFQRLLAVYPVAVLTSLPEREVMWAKVVFEEEDNSFLFELNEEGNRDGVHYDRSIEFAADTFPVGTRIVVYEPDEDDAPSPVGGSVS